MQVSQGIVYVLIYGSWKQYYIMKISTLTHNVIDVFQYAWWNNDRQYILLVTDGYLNIFQKECDKVEDSASLHLQTPVSQNYFNMTNHK